MRPRKIETQQMNFYCPVELREKIESMATAAGMSHSGFIRSLVETHWKRNAKRLGLINDPAK